MEAGDTILKGLVELGESPDDEVSNCANIMVGFFLGVDVVVLLISIFLPDAEQVVNCVFEDLGNLFGNELFLWLMKGLHLLRRP